MTLYRSPLFRRLYLGWAGCVATSLLLAYFLAARGVESRALSSIEDSLRVRALLLGEISLPALKKGRGDSLQEKVLRLGWKTRTRLTVIAADGLVLADSRKDPALMENHGSRPEILEAKKEGIGVSVRTSGTIGIRMMYLALPVREKGKTLGFARASLPLTLVDERLSSLRGALILPGILAALVGLLLGFFLFHKLTLSLEETVEGAKALASGDLSRRLPHHGKDEIAALGRAFNQMAETLEKEVLALREKRETLEAVLEGMVEGVLGVDGRGEVLYLNQCASRILRIPPSRGVGMQAREILRNRPQILQLLEKAGKGETPPEERLVFPSQDGDRILEARAAPLETDPRGERGAVLVLHDITRLSRLEKVREDFVANVSHELKTPITAIQGILETLLHDREMEPKEREEFLASAMDQALRLSSLVKDLLTLSRLESEEEALDFRPLDLVETARGVWRTFLPLLEKKGLKGEMEVPREGLPLQGDGAALRIMTANLLDNALKYTSPGGTVRLRLSRKEKEAILEVEDTGPGIEPVHQKRVFERFYRVDKARSRSLGGTGLGLSIVKHTARAHGGDVELESVPGKGSLFRVLLPLAK